MPLCICQEEASTAGLLPPSPGHLGYGSNLSRAQEERLLMVSRLAMSDRYIAAGIAFTGEQGKPVMDLGLYFLWP